jgi:hypothetical protein
LTWVNADWTLAVAPTAEPAICRSDISLPRSCAEKPVVLCRSCGTTSGTGDRLPCALRTTWQPAGYGTSASWVPVERMPCSTEAGRNSGAVVRSGEVRRRRESVAGRRDAVRWCGCCSRGRGLRNGDDCSFCWERPAVGRPEEGYSVLELPERSAIVEEVVVAPQEVVLDIAARRLRCSQRRRAKSVQRGSPPKSASDSTWTRGVLE